MRYRAFRDKAEGRRVLKAELEKKDVLDYAAARQLASAAVPALLPHALKDYSSGAELLYWIDGHNSLKTLLKAKMAGASLLSVLSQIALLPEALAANGLSSECLLYEPTYVYVDLQSGAVRFAYLPVKRELAVGAGMHSLLSFICSNVSLADAKDRHVPAGLLSLLNEQNPISVFALKSYLGLGNDSIITSEQDLDTAGGTDGLTQQGLAGEDNAGAAAMDRLLSRRRPRAAKKRSDPPFRDFVEVRSGVRSRFGFAGSNSAEQTGEAGLIQAGSELTSTVLQAPHDSTTFLASSPAAGGQAVHARAGTGNMGSDALADGRQADPHAAAVLVHAKTGERFVLSKESTTLGRSKAADICLGASKSVSREHAVLRSGGGLFYVRDCGSSNGSLVNGRRLAPGAEVLLNPGDTLTLGDLELQLQTAK